MVKGNNKCTNCKRPPGKDGGYFVTPPSTEKGDIFDRNKSAEVVGEGWWFCNSCFDTMFICLKCGAKPAMNRVKGSKDAWLCNNCSGENNLKKCDECKIEVAYHHIQGTGIKGTLSLCGECNKKRKNKDKPVGDVEDFQKKWNKWAFSYDNQKPVDKLDSLEKIQQAKNELEPYLKTPEIVNNSTIQPDVQFCPEKTIKTNEDVDEIINELKALGIIKGEDDFMVLPDRKVVAVFFEGGNKKEKIEQLKDLLKILDWKAQKFNKPTDKGKEPPTDDKNKPNDKGKEPNPNELCERCGASCIVHKDKTSYTIKRKRYIKHTVDFIRESSQWFGLNCGCIEKYKQENQGTCPQCKKREFPDMAKGWMLDYEVKMAFCSPLCHVTYRELKWEEAQRLTQIEMFPPELDVETNPGQNVDWEKEGLKREVLFWREYARELEQRLANQNNLTPEERQQSDYLRNLQQNTLRNAENNYQSRYGSLSEDGSDKGKGMSGGVIALIVIGVVAVVGGVIFLLTRNKNKKKWL